MRFCASGESFGASRKKCPPPLQTGFSADVQRKRSFELNKVGFLVSLKARSPVYTVARVATWSLEKLQGAIHAMRENVVPHTINIFLS